MSTNIDLDSDNMAKPIESNADGNIVSEILKTLDANKYATKKTIAQGLLDVALLTANASQLKYVLQVGEKHEFYTLMLTLIIISIVLQVTAALLSVIVGVMHVQEGGKEYLISWILNHISIAFVTGALFCDVLQAVLCVLLGTSLDINKEDDHPHAERANHIILCLNIIIMAVNILISTFEMKEDDGKQYPTTTTATGT